MKGCNSEELRDTRTSTKAKKSGSGSERSGRKGDGFVGACVSVKGGESGEVDENHMLDGSRCRCDAEVLQKKESDK